MARKPNYNFEKRRKEEARRQKQEEKRTRKREGNAQSNAEGDAQSEDSPVPFDPTRDTASREAP